MEPRLDCEIKKILDADGMEGLEAVYNSAADETVIYFDIPIDNYVDRNTFIRDRLMLEYLSAKLSKMYGIKAAIERTGDNVSIYFETFYKKW
jgi:hypothetical protein